MIPDLSRLPRWQPKDIIGASDLNKLSDYLWSLMRAVIPGYVEGGTADDSVNFPVVETWTGYVVAKGPNGETMPGGPSQANQDARYFVARATPTDSPAPSVSNNPLMSDVFTQHFETIPGIAQTVVATNLAELTFPVALNSGANPPPATPVPGPAAHFVPTDGSIPVQVFVFPNRGNFNPESSGQQGQASIDFYVFFWVPSSVAWIKVVSPIPANSGSGQMMSGGGGYYNGQIVSGAPVTIDPTTDLIAPINPAEVVTSTTPTACLVMNWAEANYGDSPSHEIATPKFMPGWLIGYSSETPSRPVYRVYSPREGPLDFQILAQLATWPSTGAGRYTVSTLEGNVVALDTTTNYLGLDPGTNFSSAATVYFVDVYEGGSAASGTNVLAIGVFVRGSFLGIASDGNPVYYGSSAPSGTLFKVLCTQIGGSQGNATTPASWTYDLFLFDGSGLQLGAGQSPDAARPNGQLTAATMGWAYISSDGTIHLAEAIEPPITGQCIQSQPTTYNAGPAFMTL